MRPLYLDFNATTPIAPSVLEAMQPFLSTHYGNPSSSHAIGRACREAIANARERVAMLLGAEPDEVLFTSGGTESNNLALRGILGGDPSRPSQHLVISNIEHPAISEPARYLGRMGVAVSLVGADRGGQVEAADVLAALRPDTRLVSIMHANNEIGTLQPIREIAAACRRRGVLVHTDAAQSLGKVRVNVAELEVDLLSVAGHKFYGPKGIGALYVRSGVSLEPLLHGAGHEGGLRPGTENVPYIVGLGQAAVLAARAVDREAPRLAMLRDRLLELLRGAIPELTVNGRLEAGLPNTLSVNFPGVSARAMLARTPELCASVGSACHSDGGGMSPVLQAIGLTPEVAAGTMRLSLGWTTVEDEIARAAELLIGAWESLSQP